MKQPKPSNDPPPPIEPPVPAGPQYRYFLTPPVTVVVPAGDLALAIPENHRAEVFDRERPIEVPCEEILGGAVPEISLSALHSLIPECFASTQFPEGPVTLPAQKIALAYHLVPEVETLPEEEFAPPEEDVSDLPENEGAPESIAESPAAPEAEKDFAPPAEPPVEPLESAGAALEAAPEPASPEVESEATPEDESAGESAAAKPARSRPPFSFLPNLRRRQPAPEKEAVREELPVPPPRARVRIPKPRAPETPLVPPSPESGGPTESPENESLPEPPLPPPPAGGSPADEVGGESPNAPDEAPAPPPEEEIPPPPEPVSAEPAFSEPAFVEPPEPLPPPSPKSSTEAQWIESEQEMVPSARALAEIPHQDGLQAVFMTEELMDIRQVIARCGDLPGVRSCVLSHGTAVLASHHVPENVDLVSLSAHAMEMLASMRTSVAKMGIGAVPAVTVHSHSGPITFFNQDDLCLLILHKDRGFVPGVREKLQQVIEELAQANLPLPLPAGDSGTSA